MSLLNINVLQFLSYLLCYTPFYFHKEWRKEGRQVVGVYVFFWGGRGEGATHVAMLLSVRTGVQVGRVSHLLQII